MKEKVDRILNGEAVDIAENGASYYLSVVTNSYKDEYKIAFIDPDKLDFVSSDYISIGAMRNAGKRLVALADELENRKRFNRGDHYFTVRPNGTVTDFIFSPSESGDMCRLYMGNAFKTKEEAEERKDEIVAKYQDLRDKGLV